MIYLNGKLLPAEQAHISPADRGLLLGDGVFETLRTVDGQVAFAAEHMARLEQGCTLLGIPLPQPIARLEQALLATLAANRPTPGEAVLRLTLTRGPGPRGLLPPAQPIPTLLITCNPLPAARPAPARAVLSDFRRNERSPLATIKSLNYLENILARQQAATQGADEALLLNTAGRLAGASTANLFAIIDGKMITPAPTEGALPGITRAQLLKLAHREGLATIESSLNWDSLSRASEAFLSNSLIGVWPLTQVGEVKIGTGQPGPIAGLLGQAYGALRGRSIST